jgi:exodeoxyribonuclease V alpha subunit
MPRFAVGFAGFIRRIHLRHNPHDSATAETLATLAALTIHAHNCGHVCLDLCSPPPLQLRDQFFPVSMIPLQEAVESLQRAPDVCLSGEADTIRGLPMVYSLNPVPRLYLHRYWSYEKQLETRINGLLRKPLRDQPPPFATCLFAAGEQASPQFNAVSKALARRFSLLAGGPGTGKTTVAVKVLAALLIAQPDMRIAMAAPTGKAAARMREAIADSLPRLQSAGLPDAVAVPIGQLQTTTIHRLLGSVHNKPWFRHGRSNPLPYDFVVIDEASMIDLPLMSKLMDAVGDHTGVLLIGDPYQLPSIEIGSIFADMMHAPVLQHCTTVLQENFRAREAPAIIRTCERIKHGSDSTATIEDLLAPADPAVVWHPVESPSDLIPLLALAANRYREILPLVADCKAGEELAPEWFDRINSFRILTALRHGPFGNDQINTNLARELPSHAELRLITRNDPQVNLFNGDIGIQFTTTEGSFIAFAGRAASSTLRSPQSISAFAMTGHRSQGSEFGEVHVVLPTDPLCPLLTREWLYTAVSRARGKVVLWACAAAVSRCLQTPTRRLSGLFSAPAPLQQTPAGGR